MLQRYKLQGELSETLKKMDVYKTPHKVLKAIRHTEIIYTKTKNPKGITGPLAELKGFGWKFVEKNKKILFGSRIKEKVDVSLDKGTLEV